MSKNRALNTSGSNAGLDPSGRRWVSRRTAVSPAANHLITWNRSSTWRAWPGRWSIAVLWAAEPSDTTTRPAAPSAS